MMLLFVPLVASEFLLPPPTTSVPLNTSAGFSMLVNSLHRSYRQVSIHFTTQQTQALCGIASLTAVFNAFLPAPVDPIYQPYAYWTQNSLMNLSCTAHDPSFGSTLGQLSDITKCFTSVETVSGPDVTRDIFDKLNDTSTTHIIANFDRQGLDEEGSGHFSPIAAYNKHNDTLLVLDVARYKYPPLWVSFDDLKSAMTGLDPASGQPRGLLILG